LCSEVTPPHPFPQNSGQIPRENRRKHGISFEDAQTVFFDDSSLFMEDPEHSHDEDRFILLGLSAALRLLVVCHTYRGEDKIIRLISARRATHVERSEYQQRRRR
jgi:uncharacterized protein